MRGEAGRYIPTILSLTPPMIFKNNYLLKLQWSAIETLIPCFLKALYQGNIQVLLHEFDKIFTGLRNAMSIDDEDILAKISSTWYYLTRVTHQSIGPRVGDFAEKIIGYWINEGNICKVDELVDVSLKKALSQIFGLKVNWRNKIDFVCKYDSRRSVAFIELRVSEHTGGRTGQESLMDKFNKILDLLVNDTLYRASKSLGIGSIELIIAILFNEKHELIRGDNYSRGRLSSLISYIMEENHIWGRIEKLAKMGYKFCDGRTISRELIKAGLEREHRICIERKEFKVYLKILLGDEFFKEFTGQDLESLVSRYGAVIADDIWIIYSLALNELKIAREYGVTSVAKIYRISKELTELRSFLEEFKNIYKASSKQPLNIKEYRERLNELLDKYRSKVLEVLGNRGESLKLLETNDIIQNYRYLKYICIATLALYLTIDILGDKEFSKCRWEELTSEDQNSYFDKK
jgi:hypothetical protein